MSFHDALTNIVLAGAKIRGETLDVRRLSKLDRQGKAGSEARITAATVKGAHSEDDVAVTIEVVDGTAQRLRGRLPSGLVVTVDGGSYALSADVSIAGSATSLSLPITPGLTGDLVGGEAVVLASYVEYTSVPVILGAEYTGSDHLGQPKLRLVCVPRKDAAFDLDDLYGFEFWSGGNLLGTPTEHRASTTAQWRVGVGVTT